MTYQEKRKKAIAIAVAYFVEQEKAVLLEEKASISSWAGMGKGIIMSNRAAVQRRGRLLK